MGKLVTALGVTVIGVTADATTAVRVAAVRVAGPGAGHGTGAGHHLPGA
ncbi:hypothetical protein [Streptomyces sp. NPDC058294]